MIALFTDYGLDGPYIGQIHAVLATRAPGVPVIDLFQNVPSYDIRSAAYLLPAYIAPFPGETIFLCIVDPGVGGARRPVVVTADGRRFVGPDNGLFEMVCRRARRVTVQEVLWRPEALSVSFHGRDLFAPVAAMLARGGLPESRVAEKLASADEAWPEDLAQVIYIDKYGNLVTGYRAQRVPEGTRLMIAGRQVRAARVFSDVPAGEMFWYENSAGLVEIAVNRGSAQALLGLETGAVFSWQEPDRIPELSGNKQ
jgi:hypothetical protein